MARRVTPEPWKSLMERKGISSLRHLGREADLANPSVSRLVHGDGTSQDDTIRRVAEVLGLDLPAMYKLIGDEHPEAAPYVPPAEANRLTTRQRRAIDDLIRAITAEREEEDDATQAETQAGRDPDVQGARDRAPMSTEQQQAVLDSRPVKDLMGLAADKGRDPKK